LKTEKLIYYELRFKIIACAMAVLNEIGHGYREKSYESALIVEFKRNNILFSQQKVYPLFYKNVQVDSFIPDLVVEDKIIVELKTVDKICSEHIGQIINYLRVSRLELGLIFNFKHPMLEWKAVILDDEANFKSKKDINQTIQNQRLTLRRDIKKDV
jgi:GxxExxY protein